jgi:hypothetical protein
LHVKGLPVSDRTGNGLKLALNAFLSDMGLNSKVVAVQIVPPFHRILDIEAKKRDLSDLNMLLVNKNTSFSCCIPSRISDQKKLEALIERYDEQLYEETMKPFVPSGHAFVCLQSMESVEACVNHFRASPFSYVSYMWQRTKVLFYTCLGYEDYQIHP